MRGSVSSRRASSGGSVSSRRASSDNEVVNDWWLSASDMKAAELRSHLRHYRYGDIRQWHEGSHSYPSRAPRIAFVGDAMTGKSSTINTLKAAWEGSAICKEHAVVGSEDLFGTVSFEGPFRLLHRSSAGDCACVLELFDSKGFSLKQENKKYGMAERTNTIIDIVHGKVVPGTRQSDHIPAINDQFRPADWAGVDMFVIVTRADEPRSVSTAVEFYTSLRKENIRCCLLLTCTDASKQIVHDILKNITYLTIHNYDRGGRTNEETNAQHLQVLTEILFAMERKLAGVPDLGFARQWHNLKVQHAAPIVSWTQEHKLPIFTVIVIVLLVLAVIYK